MTHHPQPFSPDDPRLSAYLLGEMEADELKAFEAELQSHPELLEYIEELRETSSLLQNALEQEPAPALSPAQRSLILSAAADAHSPTSQEKPVMKPSNARGTWAIIVAVAALSIMLVVLLNTSDEPLGERFSVAQRDSVATKTETVAKYSRDAETKEAEHRFGQNAPLYSFDPDPLDAGENLDRLSSSSRQEAEFGASLSTVAGASRPGGLRRPESLNLPALDAWPKNGTIVGQAAPGTDRPVVLDPKPASPASTPAPFELELSKGIVTLADSEKKVEELERQVGEGRESGLGWRGVKLQFGDALKADFEGDEAAEAGNDSYEPIFENSFIFPRGEQALSTFSIDVDTASYSNVRRFIKHGQRPPIDAVRIEELVNYFPYDYTPPINGDAFSVHTEVAICPWKPEHRLVRFGLKGREISKEQRPLSNLVFLVDVSGSMSDENKLPLVKKALTMLAGEMNENDRISIVTYAGDAGVKLPSTSGEQRSDIISAIQSLNAGGSTNGEAGIHLAYTEAIRNLIAGGSNRVILCTDGDFNVGVSGDDELVTLIQDKAKNSGVFLSIFGFGMGNYKDAKLEKLADKGNGHYGYIDNEREAKKVFVEELTGTLYTIAKDVKIQVEFNPAHVGAYRLIGYENRILAAQDFNDDTKDAGEIGAGHTVTALYEVIPQGVMPAVAQDVDRLKYQPAPAADPKAEPSPEMLTLKLRWKKPDEDVSVKREYPVMDPGKKALEPAADTEWQAAVAAFGMVLRNSKHKGQADLRLVKELAMGSRGPDRTGLRREFIDLLLTTERLASGQPLQPAEIPQPLPADEAEKTASVKGKYQTLLKTLAAPEDLGVYGAFNDYGYWEGKTYGDNDGLPKAHWVYVYPNWYLWESAQGK